MEKQRNSAKWRVSYTFTVPGAPGRTTKHLEFRIYPDALDEYKHWLQALTKQGDIFQDWKLCLNSIKLEPWESPKHSTSVKGAGKKKKGKRKRGDSHKWRVSHAFTVPGIQGRKEEHETFPNYEKARKEYRNGVRAFMKNKGRFDEWKICLNKIDCEPWEHPHYQEEGKAKKKKTKGEKFWHYPDQSE